MKETRRLESSRFLTIFIPHLLLFIFFLVHLTSCDDSLNIPPSDKVLLNCGSSGSSTFNGLNWIGDIGTNFFQTSYDTTSSATLLRSNSNKVAPKIPYLTARIIHHSPFTYSFPFSSPGLKFIRLYFLSTSYLPIYSSNTKSYFSVKSGPYTLVNNFNPLLAAQEINSSYVTKDFFVNIKQKSLNITFTPSPLIHKAYAFVNGIETFSVPNNLFSHASNSNVSVPYLGHKEPIFINNEYAFEKLYMVNIGTGSYYQVVNAFGSWLDGIDFISGSQYGTVLIVREDGIDMNESLLNSNDINYSAPLEVYLTARTMGSNGDSNMRYNLTWSFFVDSGFRYLVRLHFCELSMLVTDVNQRVFSVYINNQTAEENLDLVALSGEPVSPLYRDYVVMVNLENQRRKVYMLISLHPNLESKPKYHDAILNGVEIIKLSDSNYNLAPSFQLKNGLQKEKKLPIFVVVGASTFCIILILFITFFIVRRKAWTKIKIVIFHILKLNSPSRSEEKIQGKVISGNCYQFTLEEITSATNDFNEDLVIGEGGFGKVYKGTIMLDGVVIDVAIKRAKLNSRQGFKEFQNEINFHSFYHMNLVSLLGFCQESNELILVYEYMAEGSLCDHLYKKQKQPLSWNQRLEICVGAARGIHYLHTGRTTAVIHRDIKSANILLDQNLVPKIADFGLSRVVPSIYHTHVSTEVKGTFGYLDPEYYKRRKLSEKSDVYAFGVVLFEVLSGRAAVNPEAVEEDNEKVGLVEWAMHCYQCGTIDRLVDSYLQGNIRLECLMAFVEIGIQCFANKSAERPSMGEVLSNLERIMSSPEHLERQEFQTVDMSS
ncbi:receptor-like protein kinase FERONIA [Vicia villosa]|uniref:receptor-like protein kinase FERONIA n=1 Tax=Vicia villosa TaxID=3911 RepID=UPI00273B44A2|nr:receptor-like protein kinase FERONIA [Vicia villosa]